jgi:hypothetical protein
MLNLVLHKEIIVLQRAKCTSMRNSEAEIGLFNDIDSYLDYIASAIAVLMNELINAEMNMERYWNDRNRGNSSKQKKIFS